ncbi:hypothetical protein SAMN05877753_105137 [Bacillus oleivorans]|uniref:Uncharacterized protein n=1 Tax=Bacillus oleivorans TaxID=1448271 RepID=A0A285CUX6_9BACI|nr:hypothetical protein [Bacillus oleivorans]SNX71370.1 hypothetical protein SAMN05877753_105137 [Bacillus oleivorans]
MKGKVLLIILTMISLLTACSVSSEDMKSHATNVIDEALTEQVKEPNETTGNGKLYLPFLMSVTDVSPSNIILEKGSQTYILFYNQIEEPNSKELYNSLINSSESILFHHSIEKEGEFAYLAVEELEKDQVILTVGIGGKKMTTETTTKNVPTDIGIMIEIIRSFEPSAQTEE